MRAWRQSARGGWVPASCMQSQRQLAQPLSRQPGNRVGHRWSNVWHRHLADPTRLLGARHDVHLHHRHLIQAQHAVVVVVRFLHAPVLEVQRAVQCRTEAKGDARFHLRDDRFGVYDGAAIDGTDHPVHSTATVLNSRWRGEFLSSARRYSTGSLSADCASSSIRVSTTKAVWLFPTERHHKTGMPVLGECSSTRWFGISLRYGESAKPSTDVESIPFLTAAFSNTVPIRIDCPTTVCCQASGWPSAPRPMRARCRKADR